MVQPPIQLNFDFDFRGAIVDGKFRTLDEIKEMIMTFAAEIDEENLAHQHEPEPISIKDDFAMLKESHDDSQIIFRIEDV